MQEEVDEALDALNAAHANLTKESDGDSTSNDSVQPGISGTDGGDSGCGSNMAG